jgi:hypothetical protein
MQRAVHGLAALRHANLELAAVRAELDVAADSPPAAGGDTRFQVVDGPGDEIGRISDVAKNAVREVAQHLVDPDALREMQRKSEVGSRHRARFYSESRPNSTRARSQSAAI